MPQLSIGPDFFRKERDNAYSNWGDAFPREFVQNSIDAGTSVLDIRFMGVIHRPDLLRVVVADNGCGMSRETLDNVFFKLGASTKDSGETIGGFGRARIMTHFAAERYEIATHSLRVVGAGAQYDYVPAEEYVDGCTMIIDVLPVTRYGDAIDLKQKFIDYMNLCQLPCRVFIDGERHTEWTYRRKLLKPLCVNNAPFANLYVNKSAIDKDAEGVVLVRVDGTLMYKRNVQPKVQIILEVEPSKSREVLQSSRDGMHWDFRRELDEFIDKLNTETKSALRTEEKESKPISGTGSFVAYRKDVVATLTNRANGRIAADHSVLPDVVDAEIDRTAHGATHGFDLRKIAAEGKLREVRDVTPQIDPETLLSATESDEDDLTAEESGFDDDSASDADTATEAPPTRSAPIVLDEAARNRLFDILMFSDTGEFTDEEKRAVKAVIPSYSPLNWKATKTKFKGLQKAKLLLIWKTICHHVVQEALHQFDMEKIAWGVGWNFDSDNAKHHNYEDVHYLLLNPVGKDGKLKYELRKADHLNAIFALAVHEVTHVKHDRHDEEYASAVTELTGRCLKHLPAIKKGIRDVYKVRMV